MDSLFFSFITYCYQIYTKLNYFSSFADTKNAAADPLRASSAYKEIMKALRNASEAVEGAKKAAEFAYTDADQKSEISMVNMALQTKNRSMAIKEQADELSLKDLENERLTATKIMNKLKETLQDSMKRKLIISKFEISIVASK